ncbi:MAG: carboxypeptidase regulatory-like domain-containing protein, partial [Rhodoferax sp.]|nr:carboxypeptidase regulatory-like domain-containing protein [Rhodoferax sp.]
MLLLLCTMAFSFGKKTSAVEGKLVDWNNKPVAGVKITAVQVQPIKGYEQFEAVTGADGSFTLKGLFPSSAYVLKPWSDKWTTRAEAKVDSAPQGETAVLPQPLKIEMAFAKKGGSKVLDLATGAVRFEVSADGMITDGQTKLEWVVGPDKDTNYAQ